MRRLSLVAPSVLTVAVTVAALGCGSSGVVPNGGVSRSINLSGPTGSTRLQYFEDVNSRSDYLSATPAILWPKLGTAYTALSVPITTVDSANHILGAIRASVMGRFGKRPISYALDCGQNEYGAPRANSYRVTLTVLTELAPSGRGTRITSVVSGFAQEASVSSTSAQCSSTGALETDIERALAAP